MRDILQPQIWHRSLVASAGIVAETASFAGTTRTAKQIPVGVGIGNICGNQLFETMGSPLIEMRVHGAASDNDTIGVTVVGWPMPPSGGAIAAGALSFPKGFLLFDATFTFGTSTHAANFNPITGGPETSYTAREADTIAYTSNVTTTQEWDAAGGNRAARLIFSPQVCPVIYAFVTARSAATVVRVDIGLRRVG